MLKKSLFMSLLVLTALGLQSCAVPNWVPFFGGSEESSHEVKTFHQKQRAAISIQEADIDDFVITQRQFDMQWLYSRYGKNIDFLKSKINYEDFGKPEYYRLIKRAYIQSDEQYKHFHKIAAIRGLEHSIYDYLYENPLDRRYTRIRNLIYNPKFLNQMFQHSSTLLGLIPESLAQYYDVIFQALEINPESFESLSMRYKTDPKVLNYLFYNMSNKFEHPYQKTAIEYANDDLAKTYLSRNGLLLQYISKERQDNYELVYIAALQNENAADYASSRLRRIIEKQGAEYLMGTSANLYILKEKSFEKLFFIWDGTKSIVSNVWNGTVSLSQSLFKKVKGFVINEEITDDFSEEEVEEDVLTDLKDLSYKVDESIVVDPQVIMDIEKLHDRPLQYLWHLISIDRDRDVYIAYYKPRGKNYLASMVLKIKDQYKTSDYAAIYTLDGSTIWRVDDQGKFSPDEISILNVQEGRKRELILTMEWKTQHRTSLYRLIEKDSILTKEFVTHTESLD